ncbi:hypothetical protein TEA_021353 [Camellia sinensis var. sinensis]|uniref:Uncharacterized protein n=1 Tax=Camellia sinensis var. sinensis TaxID=542762 RepID=A0A4S4DLF7_CAMSN|nr:hypothetical protein TEA_021353 [Camellia sinensis var. sinensis]
MDKMGNLRSCLCEDTKRLLYLYEASYLSIDGESLLNEARDFTTRNLKENLKKKDIDQNLAMLVRHSLEFPLHWRVPRLEARWFIDVWWRSACLGKKLSFARDRLMENFLGTLGVNFEPQFGYVRRMSTKVYTLITIIDDIYDVYGSLEELELFTNAVERWDINAMEQLPDYMKICFLALFNSINEMAYDALKEQGLHIISHLKKVDELQRGDVSKSIQCYMHETGAPENDAREHMKYLIGETWKKMNEDGAANSLFTKTFIGNAMNLARMAQCMYQCGDGYGARGKETKYRVLSLVVNPVPLM